MQMEDNSVNFPQEIVKNILSRLPPKPLCKFKCVSKPWLALISSPHFIKMHLEHHKNKEQTVILISQCKSLFTIRSDQSTATKVNFPPLDWVKLLGSCNGLVLVADRRNSLFLVNPSTRVYDKLPSAPWSIEVFSFCISFGLGYDSSLDDYKVIRVAQFDFANNTAKPIFCPSYFGSGLEGPEINADAIYGFSEFSVCVYALRTRRWRRIQSSTCNHSIIWPSPGVFVNDSLHWVARHASRSMVIVSFDLANESFREIVPPPSLLSIAFSFFGHLTVLGGCLTFFMPTGLKNNLTGVWVMKAYGVRESWITFKVALPIPNMFPKSPLCILSNGEVVLAIDGNRLIIYNPRGRIRSSGVCGIPEVFRDSGAYVESLVSPKSGYEFEGRDETNNLVLDINLIPRTLNAIIGVSANVEESSSFGEAKRHWLGWNSSIDKFDPSTIDRCTLSDCLDCLEAMEVVEGESIYKMALNLFKDPKTRSDFMKIPNENKLSWLKRRLGSNR